MSLIRFALTAAFGPCPMCVNLHRIPFADLGLDLDVDLVFDYPLGRRFCQFRCLSSGNPLFPCSRRMRDAPISGRRG